MPQEISEESLDRVGGRLLNRIISADRGYVLNGEPSPCWEYAMGRTSAKYGSIVVYDNGRRLVISCHRLSAAYFRLKDVDGSVFTLASDSLVLHDCNNQPCFNPDHLHFGDHEQNNFEVMANGKHTNQRALDKKQIKLLKKWHRMGKLPRAAHALGITYVQALKAVKGKTYKEMAVKK